jgi:uncharacterized protein YpuA (DUF1002 family)
MAAKSGKVITLGESLSDTQRREMLDYFKANDDDEVVTVTEADTDEAMKGILDDVGGSVSGAYSSTALTCRDLGDGLIVTTRNINLITPSMYAMALVTAGIGDATLVVSGPSDSTALGTTAMAGVFLTFELAKCDSGDTSRERQRLALEQLALTADIGQAISTDPDRRNGVQPAANVILDTQKTIVTEKLTRSSDIDDALRAQEQAKGVSFPVELRSELIDLFVRLAKADIDWSTFSAGWEIERNETNTRITMTGDGIAVRRARQTATAEAAAARTATAEAKAALTATAEAEQAALATQQAIAAMTATAAAQPTATPTPLPTPTPSPFAVTGKVTDVNSDQLQLSVKADGQDAATQYTVDGDAAITRDGEQAVLADVAKGDTVNLTVDGNTNHVRAIVATAAPIGLVGKIVGFWWLIPLAGLAPFALVLKGRAGGDAFVVKRVATA